MEKCIKGEVIFIIRYVKCEDLTPLIFELKKNKEGWVDVDKFIEDINLSLTGIPQLIGILRKSLIGVKFLDKDSAKELIKNNKNKKNAKNKKGGFYRISNHPDLISYDKEKLLSHADIRIRKLAEELP